MVEQGKKAGLLALLFDQEGMTAENIKFFRGEGDVISEESFCHEVHSGLLQRRMGKATISSNFEEDEGLVDVNEFVASL